MEYNIQGTRTETNLRKAFEGESKAAMKYFHFADVAGDDGFHEIEKVFLETMKNEQEHAEEFLEYLGGIGDTATNLKLAMAAEGFESSIDYPEMARVAKEEGFDEISRKFDIVAKIEKQHKERFEKLLKLVEENKFFKRATKQQWECIKCGYVHEGFEPPGKCPFCEHTKSHFEIRNVNY